MDEAVRIEHVALGASPAAETAIDAGWLLRHTPGVQRRRSNSALALVPHADPVVVRRFYARRGAEPMIQVTPARSHGALDASLHAGGWRFEAPTTVLTAPVPAVAAVPMAGGDHGTDLPSTSLGVEIDEHVGESWVAAWELAAGGHARQQAERIVSRITDPIGTALARDAGGEPVGSGLVVIAGEWAGVFSMATVPDARRRGVGSAVLRALAAHAQHAGATRLYLQLENDNEPARALYARAGFVPSHGYHYRVAT